MSFNVEVAHWLSRLYANTMLTQTEPASYIVPVMAQTVPNSNNNDQCIYMDHHRLPTPSNYTFFGSNVLAHKLNDFVYECMAQQNSGCFHLVNAAGLFSIGAKEWITDSGVNNNMITTLNIIRTVDEYQYSTSTLLTGNQQAQVFMAPGDMFNVSFQPELNTSNNLPSVTIDSATDVLVTRLSRNPYYSPQIIV